VAAGAQQDVPPNQAGKAIDPLALLDSASWTAWQKLLTALVALAILIDGLDIQILAFSIPSLAGEWHVARSAFAPVLALGLVGIAIGGPAFGYFGDRAGRRPALIGSVSLFAAATLLTCFSTSLLSLTIFRFIAGLGIGGAVPGATALAAEYAPRAKRPIAVKLTIVCVPLGGMLGGLIAARILPLYGWRALYLIGGAAPLLLAVVLWRFLPESPQFLAQSAEDAPRLRMFLSRAGHALSPESVFISPVLGAAGRGRTAELFAPEYRRNSFGLWIAFFFCLGGVYLVFGWLPTLLSGMGLGLAASSSGLAAYNTGGVLGVLIWASLTSRFGSKKPMLWGSGCAAASALLMRVVPVHSGELLFAALGLHGLLVNAVQVSLYALGAHVYPTRIRAQGVAFAATLGRVGGILSSLYGGVLISSGPAGFWNTLCIAMLAALVGLAIVHRHIPAAH
jgi:AAHS family 4-hydroxybenzoate transporter-like MFS transporter